MSYVTWECVSWPWAPYTKQPRSKRSYTLNVYKNKTRIFYIDHLFVLKTNMQVILQHIHYPDTKCVWGRFSFVFLSLKKDKQMVRFLTFIKSID